MIRCERRGRLPIRSDPRARARPAQVARCCRDTPVNSGYLPTRATWAGSGYGDLPGSRPVSRGVTAVTAGTTPEPATRPTDTEPPAVLFAEAAVPGGVVAQCPQEVDAAEVGPVGVAEPELRVHALPEQEPGQPLLPEVRITRSGSGWPDV